MKENRAAVEAYLQTHRATQEEIADALNMDLHVVNCAVRRMRIVDSPLLEQVIRAPQAGGRRTGICERHWKTEHLQGVWR